MPKKLTDIQLWAADRSAEIAIPGGDGVLDYLVKNPFIREKLGEEHQLTLEVKSGTTLAIAKKGEAHELAQGKILRFVYDDSSIFEWRITQGSRDFSGGQDVMIKAKPIYTDLSRRIVRRTLSTGVTRSSISFYGQSVETVLTKLLSSDYNCPSYITLGTISNDVKQVEINDVLVDRTVNITLNAEYLMSAIAKVCELAGAEWDASYDSLNDVYELNFVASGMLGGGEAEAGDRPITMGGNRSNRLDMVRRDEDENYFSRIVPTAGQSNEVIGIGDLKFEIASINYTGAGIDRSSINLEEPLILKDNYGTVDGETVYFGVENDWYEVATTIEATNTIQVLGDARGLPSKGMFKIGLSKDELIFLEDPEAIDEVGAIEEKYVRTDIVPYENIAEELGISVALSEWSSGLPVGFAKIDGAETVAQETNEVYTLHGDKAAKVSCGAEQGLETIGMDIAPEDLSPYFSISAYLRCESGAVRVEVVDSANNVYPANEVAETSIDVTRIIQIGGMELPDDTVKIRFVAQVTGTVFYLDALTFTQSATPVNFAPLMGKKALWLEASRYLKKFSGDRPDVWTGSVIDESWFSDVAGAKEISVGSYVTVQEDYNEGTSSFDTEQALRVIEVSYHESPEDGRFKKNVRLSESKSLLANVLNENYVRNQSLQNVQSVGATPSKPTFDEDADATYLKKSENLGDVQSAALSRVSLGLGPDDEPQFAGATIGGFVVEDEFQELHTDVIENHLSVEALWDSKVSKGQTLQLLAGDGVVIDDETARTIDENLSWNISARVAGVLGITAEDIVLNFNDPLYNNGGSLDIYDHGSGQPGIVNTGAQTFYGAKTFANQTTFNDTVYINADIIQNGDPYETHAEQIYTTKDFIISREGAVSALAAGDIAGLEVLKADGTNDVVFGVDSNAIARVGWQAGTLQAIATREDSPETNGIPYWDNVNTRFSTSANLLFDGTKFTVSDAFYLESSVFTGTGFTDSGVQIKRVDGLWRLVLDDAIFRGAVYLNELIVNQISSLNGSEILSPGRGKIESVSGSSPTETVVVSDPQGGNYASFKANDICLCQQVRPNDNQLVKRIVRQVDSVTGNSVTFKAHSGAPTDAGYLADGDLIVAIGNTTDAARQAIIWRSVTETGGPITEIKTGIDSWTAWLDQSNIPYRAGYMDDFTFNGQALSGYGAFFKDNLYVELAGGLGYFGKGADGADDDGLYFDANNYWLANSGFKAQVLGDDLETAVQELRSDLIELYLSSEGAYSGIQFLAGQVILTTNVDGKLATQRLDSTGDESLIQLVADNYLLETDDLLIDSQAQRILMANNQAALTDPYNNSYTGFFLDFDGTDFTWILGDTDADHIRFDELNGLQLNDLAKFGLIAGDFTNNGDGYGDGIGLKNPETAGDAVFWAGSSEQDPSLVTPSNSLFVLYDDGNIVHPALGGPITVQTKQAAFGTITNDVADFSDAWNTPASTTSAINVFSSAIVKRFKYEHQFGMNKMVLSVIAKRTISSGPGITHLSEIRLIVDGVSHEVEIINNTYNTYTIEADISGLTVGSLYGIGVETYAEVTGNGTDTAETRTYLREDFVLSISTKSV